MNKLVRVARLLNQAATWSLMDQAVISGGNFLLSLLLARQMGLEGFGLYTLWYMLPLMVLSLSQACIVQPFQAFWAEEKERGEQYATTVWQMQLLFGGLVLFLVIIGAVMMQSMLPLWAGALAVAQSAFDFLRKYSYAKGSYQKPFFWSAPLYGGILLVLLFWPPHSVEILFVLLFSAYAGAVVVGAKALSFSIQLRPLAGLTKYIKKHYHYSFWLLGAALVQWLSGNAFLLAAAALLSHSALGGLRLTQQLIGITHIVFLAMENRIPVTAAQHFQNGSFTALKNYLQRTSTQYGFIVLALLLTLQASGPLLRWIYEPAVVDEVLRYLPLYTLFYLLVFLTIPLRIALRSMQKTAPIFWSYALMALVGSSMAYPFVQTWGWKGVFAGLFLTQLMAIGIYLWQLYPFGLAAGTSKSVT